MRTEDVGNLGGDAEEIHIAGRAGGRGPGSGPGPGPGPADGYRSFASGFSPAVRDRK